MQCVSFRVLYFHDFKTQKKREPGEEIMIREELLFRPPTQKLLGSETYADSMLEEG